MTLDEGIQGMRLQVIRRAAEVGVTTACEEAGISRTLFYRWQNKLTLYGVDGLHPRRQRGRPGPRPELPPRAERQILAVAIAHATWGCRRLAGYLARWWRLTLAPSMVQRLLHRHGLGTRRQRLLVLEHQSARQAGLLTERTRRALVARSLRGHAACERRRAGRAGLPGHLLHRQPQGRRQGLADHGVRCGQFLRSRCHPAGTHVRGGGRVPPRGSRAALPQEGWPIQRVLTDGGPEFKRAFDEACAALGIRHTRTKPRHAWTNGFVERLQQTILHEHWRVIFRRHYFTSRAVLHRTLQQFMQFYNVERPHHGYRTRGRTPASIVFGVRAVAR
jgi:transposase